MNRFEGLVESAFVDAGIASLSSSSSFGAEFSLIGTGSRISDTLEMLSDVDSILSSGKAKFEKCGTGNCGMEIMTK